MTYVVVTITYFLLIGFLLWKNEAGTYIRHMTPHHLVCILKTSLSILTEVVLTMSLTFACVYTLCGLRKALPDSWITFRSMGPVKASRASPKVPPMARGTSL